MNNTLKENWLEALVGLIVIAVAAWFVSYAYHVTSGASSGGSYELKARFPSAAGIGEGTDVRVSGMKVGEVTGLTLDPKTYQAIAQFQIDRMVKLPADSTAAITQQGILGGSYISLVPGGDSAMLKPGDEITDTQGSTDLMNLIGSVVNRTGSGDGGASAGSGQGAAASMMRQAKPAPAPSGGDSPLVH